MGLDIIWIYSMAGPADELEVDMSIGIKTAKVFPQKIWVGRRAHKLYYLQA